MRKYKNKVFEQHMKRAFLKNKDNVFGDYLSLTISNVALAPVAKFHSFAETKFPLSSKTLNPAVFGPEVP